jgi:hypothetical protein
MTDKNKTFRKQGSMLNLNGMAWSPAACNVAHSIIRTYGQVEIVGLPGPPKPLGFITHPALEEWSDQQLNPKALK